MTVTIHTGDCRDVLATLPTASVDCIVTSPPYFGLRDYGKANQIGLEPTPDAFVAEMVDVFREARRVLRDDGTLWLNIGDSYAVSGKGGNPADSQHRKQATNVGSLVSGRKRTDVLKPKDLIGIPWRVAFALQADGWYLRQDIIWSKPNPMPESVRDRCTKAHEYIFLLSKSERYYYDADAIAEPAKYAGHVVSLGDKSLSRGQARAAGRLPSGNGNAVSVTVSPTRNRRSVWTITTKTFGGAHFATFPPELAELCTKAGCRIGGVVLDPFGGAGTTGLVADRLGRNAILIELNPDYAEMARHRLAEDAPLLAEVV